jgi:hypothetical protein
MVLQSGFPPYEYAVRSLPFRAPDYTTGLSAIGPSGILLEQAQFVITAEQRRWNRLIESHILPTFKLYTHTVNTPSGYDPKADGSTLSEFVPGSLIFIDPIQETRTALEDLFDDYAADTDFSGDEYKADWLQNAYVDSFSGFYTDHNGNTGHYAHRLPSEVGVIDYASEEVLGSSGVLYDIDFGEVMFNPYPHMSFSAFRTAHGLRAPPNFGNDTFNIQVGPLFPAFQTTAGGLIGLTGREPDFLTSVGNLYDTRHISVGVVRCDGYMLSGVTNYRLATAKGSDFSGADDFTFAAGGIRNFSNAGELDLGRVFLTPKAQNSGVYRMAAINQRSVFPNTAIESGTMSVWPRIERSWPGQEFNVAGIEENLGYHVFDDTIWITDISPFGTTSKASGLAVLSPYTGHPLWVRYAELVNDTSTDLNWPDYTGLERPSNNTIYRTSPTIVTTVTAVSGRAAFQEFNDNLDYQGETLSTSAIGDPLNPNEFPLLGDAVEWSDMMYDGTNYWVFNQDRVGVDAVKFDSSFNYVEKYVFNPPTGVKEGRCAYLNGKHRIFDGVFAGGPQLVTQSGIIEWTAVDSSDNGGATPGVITLGTEKIIDGEKEFGVKNFAEIFDMFEVTGAAHIPNGVYCLIRYSGTAAFETRFIHLLRLEEGVSTWSIVAIYVIDTLTTSLVPFYGRIEGLEMDI